jgi:hypothetical protein
LSGLTFQSGELPLAKQVVAEAGELVVPDAVLVLTRVCLRERFSARSGPLARARGHAITVVAQFVQEDVQELEGPCLTFRPLDQPVACGVRKLNFRRKRRDSKRTNRVCAPHRAFVGRAALYARYRRDYPAEFVLRLRQFSRDGHGRLLDLGCGTGQLLLQLAGFFDEVVGIDPEPDMLREAERAARERRSRMPAG